MARPEPDYPAAHSMDTEWYAVDRDGHVALFQSGESGAVPDGALNRETSPPEALAEALGSPPHRLLDWLGERGQEHHVDLPPRDAGVGPGKVLMFVTSLSAVRQEINRHRASHEPASEGVAVLHYNLPADLAWWIHENGACLGCFSWPDEELGVSFETALPGRLGLFRYHHQVADWIAGAYLRLPPPNRPLRLEQLPPGLREAIGRVRFLDLSFAETREIQPVGLVPCSAWGDAYLDADGVTVRPIPGCEVVFDPAEWARIPLPRIEPPPPPGDSS